MDEATPTRRQLLQELKHDELVGALGRFDLEVSDRRQRALLIAALSREEISAEALLEELTRDRLKELCRNLGLDDKGRSKAVLTARLAGYGSSNRSAKPAPRTGQEQLTLFPSHMAEKAKVGTRQRATFSVDTHLFRELGELLVGRDSTALVELIKNAYDADAEEVTVYGEAIGDAERGYIKIVDRNGNGMTLEEFKRGFLRIASRLKEKGKRHSRRYRRRYTGAKGIGRLAAHKLARTMEIFTVPKMEHKRDQRFALWAVIDWDKVEEHETLAELEDTDAVKLETLEIPAAVETGTEITLRRLRGNWGLTERKRFIDEVQTFEPPPILSEGVKDVAPESMLDELTVRGESGTEDPGFHVKLEGDFEPGEDYWDVIAQSATWFVEIHAQPKAGIVKYGIHPTRTLLRDRPEAENAYFEVPHKVPGQGPFFQARVFIRDSARRGKTEVREWARRSTGIKVFAEGFRVPPYGERGNDWLELDADYNQRSRPMRRLENLGFQTESKEGLTNLPNSSYFGAVFLTQDGAVGLRPLVNREGFVPNTAYHRLTEMVRVGIDLATRQRAALRHKVSDPQQDGEPPDSKPEDQPASKILADSLQAAAKLAQAARASTARGDVDETAKLVEDLEDSIRDAQQSYDEATSSSAMFQVLASVGTQMATFVHEIRGLLEMAEAFEQQLGRIRSDESLSRQARVELGRMFRNMVQMRQALERQAAYLMDIVTPDARRRRSRQRLNEVFEAAWRLVVRHAERRNIRVVNTIPDDLRSLPMFRAEIVAVLANLLTNAVKAAGTNGEVRAIGEENEGIVVLKIENTGAAVDPGEGEKWFRPFESTTVDVEPALGQGMGLGLPLTRSMLEEYGADVQFVQPDPGYATCVQVRFHTKKR